MLRSVRLIPTLSHLPSSTQCALRWMATLRGACGCGSTGFEAEGHSSLNFTCHCSLCRAASGESSLSAAGFKPEQVRWTNEAGLAASVPRGSSNTRYHCNSCGQYMGEDAVKSLGVVALPLASATTADDTSSTAGSTTASTAAAAVPDEYRPNHHIFYGSRVVDVDDGLPKWETLPQGNLVQPTAPGATPTSSPALRTTGYDSASGKYTKDALPASPPRPPYPTHYTFTETDPIPNHTTYVSPESVPARVARKYNPSPGAYVAPAVKRRDVIIVGGGHNGLVAAAYLGQAGLDVCVLERRHKVGGAAVTEEIIPGFKFSRASYLAGLFRPDIIADLGLEDHGFEYIPRDPSSFTPSRLDGPFGGKSLMLGSDEAATHASIAQFSAKDADAYFKYEEFLGDVRAVVKPLLDGPPPNPLTGSRRERMDAARRMSEMVRVGARHKDVLVPFYELFTAPASHILDRWFESEMLKTTLATDAVIGALCSPSQAGSAYVLLHHVMGEAAGVQGVWSYVRGGMGAISDSIATAAKLAGVDIVTNATVDRILYTEDADLRLDGSPPAVRGVRMADGTELHADTVLTNATPYHTFLELLPGLSRDSGNAEEASPLPADFQHHVRFADYSCGAFKINCAVDRLPNFECLPSPPDGSPGPQHHGTIHFENFMEEIEFAYREASMGMPATRPVIEMTVPSALDNTLAPEGKHVVQLFVQFAPYDVDPKYGHWADPGFKDAFADRVFGIVDEFCPGFSSSVIGRDVLSPLDLERIFGLHKGNIFHGALSLHQLGYARPMSGFSSHRSPLTGLYMCGAGAHPGGGVMGAAGRNAAKIVLGDLGM